MRIIADQNIPLLSELLAAHVELVLVNGREISPPVVKDADALLVRSITRVDARLLENSRVSFVGTATAGVDHIDREWLATRGIGLATAAGANASAVADYVMAAVSNYMLAEQADPAALRCGVIGVGHVGSEVARRLSALGCDVSLCDPPRKQAGDVDAQEFVSLGLLGECDIVSVHVPLVADGEHQTEGLISGRFLASLPPKAMCINSSRGEVLEEDGAIDAMNVRPDLKLVLDVFQHEPSANQQLVALALLATPHIAGYSSRAKSTAACQVVMALAAHFKLQVSASQQAAAEVLSVHSAPELTLKAGQNPWQLPAACFDINSVSQAFKQSVALSGGQSAFDLMRKDLATRMEFSQREIGVEAGSKEAELVSALGFTVTSNR